MEDRRGLGFVVGMNLVCCKEQNWRSDGRMVGEKVREGGCGEGHFVKDRLDGG